MEISDLELRFFFLFLNFFFNFFLGFFLRFLVHVEGEWEFLQMETHVRYPISTGRLTSTAAAVVAAAVRGNQASAEDNPGIEVVPESGLGIRSWVEPHRCRDTGR